MRAKTLIIDGRRIEKLMPVGRAMKIVEMAFKAHGRNSVQMPSKIYIHLDKYDGDFRAMPAYIQGMKTCGVKWVNVHPMNKKYGLPAVMALIILSDVRTGFPLAVMDGTHITKLRTGAAGAIAAKYLANKNSSRVGLVGCGTQALFQLAALNEIFDLKEAALYDNDPEHAALFGRAVRRFGLRVTQCAAIADCVRDKDIVVTTTPSRKPIVRPEWVSPGTHINAIGADAKGKEELSPALLKKSRIFVDDRDQAVHSGEINVPISKKIMSKSDICATLGEVITGKKTGRRFKSDITIFDSTGLAIQDIAVADQVYNKINASRESDIYSIRF